MADEDKLRYSECNLRNTLERRNACKSWNFPAKYGSGMRYEGRKGKEGKEKSGGGQLRKEHKIDDVQGRQSEGESETTAAELLKGCCCCKRNALGTATSRVLVQTKAWPGRQS
ncbi:hypothetical protein WR25_18022 [Diploscapter pachys]|uniref:Uncharacterized protein n=1 Tax=Diploscapter pachys TaxID=2018661 RepID=A0A2A2KMP4_9BILA|nr:hypothetical protein WR25_18022 [Diploscapter pachys]